MRSEAEDNERVLLALERIARHLEDIADNTEDLQLLHEVYKEMVRRDRMEDRL